MQKEIEDFKKLLTVVETQHSSLQTRKALLEKAVNDLREEKLRLQKVLEVFQYLMESKAKATKERFKSLLNYGLKIVFKDQDLKIELEESLERNKLAMKISLLHNGVNHPLIGSFGGGVVNVVANLIRILALVSLKQKKLLVLDEQFSMVSDSYAPAVGEMLKTLCDKLDLDVLLITHQEAFKEYADTIYYVDKDPQNRLKVKEVVNSK